MNTYISNKEESVLNSTKTIATSVSVLINFNLFNHPENKPKLLVKKKLSKVNPPENNLK